MSTGGRSRSAKKRRRKIEVAGLNYLWWVALDDDSPETILHIVSTDKRLILRDALGQGGRGDRHIEVVGPCFLPVRDAGGRWLRARALG